MNWTSEYSFLPIFLNHYQSITSLQISGTICTNIFSLYLSCHSLANSTNVEYWKEDEKGSWSRVHGIDYTHARLHLWLELREAVQTPPCFLEVPISHKHLCWLSRMMTKIHNTDKEVFLLTTQRAVIHKFYNAVLKTLDVWYCDFTPPPTRNWESTI
jgi:hypothetical protein